MDKRRIVLGISGGIAAYKTPQLVRDLIERGAEVRVVLTDAAKHFVTPLALQTVSGSPVATDLLDAHQESSMGHIDLARWADTVLIAPATANTIAQLAHGHANDLLTTLCLATQAPIWLAPAMNTQMWQHPLTQRNLATLISIGTRVLEPEHGTLACGETGPGRMMATPLIANALFENTEKQSFIDKHILITAGPTHESIDPVRYIANHSSGKMGYTLAQAAQALGAHVTLISGPTQLTPPTGITTINILSAQDMLQAVQQHLNDCDIFIGAAAVCDYRMQTVSQHKIKKGNQPFQPAFEPTPDIIAQVAQHTPKPFVVGFAAETHNTLEHAKDKCLRKQLDMIIANDVSQGDVFNQNENTITIITPQQPPTHYPRDSKVKLAYNILEHINASIDNPSQVL